MKNDIEEKILNKVLCCHERLVELPFAYKKMLAKEIYALFKDYYQREFLEWIIFDDNSPFYFEKHKGKNMYWHEELDKYFNLDYVYNFWQNNIKDK